MRIKRTIALSLCAAMLMCLGACKKNEVGKIENGVYTDAYQSVSEKNFDELTIKMRTSSAAYFPGSVIAITAVIENDSDKYYAVAPFGEGFDMSVAADGYELEIIDTGAKNEIQLIAASDTDAASQTDAAADGKKKEMLVLEPHGSVSITKEYMTNALVNGEIVPLWECEVTAQLSVEVGKGCESKTQAVDSTEFESKTTKTVFNVYGTGNKPN